MNNAILKRRKTRRRQVMNHIEKIGLKYAQIEALRGMVKSYEDVEEIKAANKCRARIRELEQQIRYIAA